MTHTPLCRCWWWCSCCYRRCFCWWWVPLDVYKNKRNPWQAHARPKSALSSFFAVLT